MPGRSPATPRPRRRRWLRPSFAAGRRPQPPSASPRPARHEGRPSGRRRTRDRRGVRRPSLPVPGPAGRCRRRLACGPAWAGPAKPLRPDTAAGCPSLHARRRWRVRAACPTASATPLATDREWLDRTGRSAPVRWSLTLDAVRSSALSMTSQSPAGRQLRRCPARTDGHAGRSSYRCARTPVPLGLASLAPVAPPPRPYLQDVPCQQ